MGQIFGKSGMYIVLTSILVALSTNPLPNQSILINFRCVTEQLYSVDSMFVPHCQEHSSRHLNAKKNIISHKAQTQKKVLILNWSAGVAGDCEPFVQTWCSTTWTAVYPISGDTRYRAMQTGGCRGSFAGSAQGPRERFWLCKN